MSSLIMSIPVGSWLLQRGFKVRGTLRDVAQSSWLLEGRFKPFAEAGNIQLVSVPDLGAEGAYGEAIKGASAIMHVAFVTNLVPDPNMVITPMVKAVRSIMNAAMEEPSVKEVLFTGTDFKASPLTAHADNGTIDCSTWNETALEAAWAPPPFDASRTMLNYAASKIAAEKEVWKFARETKVPFKVNVVSPAGLIGEPLHKKHVAGPANWIVHGYRGNKAAMDPLEANVEDVALVHVAAILDPEVKDARIQSWGRSTHWNEILTIFRNLRPERQFVEDYPEPYHLQISVDQSDALALIKKWSDGPKKDGWVSLEESVRKNISNPNLENE